MSDDGTPIPRIGAPATGALAAIGVTTLEGVQAFTPDELLALHGFGPKALRLLSEELESRGMAFASEA